MNHLKEPVGQLNHTLSAGPVMMHHFQLIQGTIHVLEMDHRQLNVATVSPVAVDVTASAKKVLVDHRE